MTSLSSHELVEVVDAETARQARALRERGIDPHLAAIVVGPDDRFAELKQRHGRAVGVETSIYRLPLSATVEDIAGVIGFLNVDPSVHGILIQLPLPLKSDATDQLIAAIAPTKDVDGLGTGRDDKPAQTLADLVRDTHHRGHFLPTTAWAMLALADHFKLDLTNALVVGQGRLVGQPLDQLLDQLKIKHQNVDLQTKSRDKIIAVADVILAGTDTEQPIFNRTTVKKDVAIIAASTEIDHDDLETWASALSPARGGVGPLTIALLHQQTVIAAAHAHA